MEQKFEQLKKSLIKAQRQINDFNQKDFNNKKAFLTKAQRSRYMLNKHYNTNNSLDYYKLLEVLNPVVHQKTCLIASWNDDAAKACRKLNCISTPLKALRSRFDRYSNCNKKFDVITIMHYVIKLEKEQKTFDIISKYLFTNNILQYLKIGGSLVFRLFGTYKHCTQRLLLRLNKLFNIRFVKPIHSKNTNCERFVVCTQYKTSCSNEKEFLKYVYEYENSLTKNQIAAINKIVKLYNIYKNTSIKSSEIARLHKDYLF